MQIDAEGGHSLPEKKETSSSVVASDAIRLGKIVERYILIRCIGVGGMGEVYEAYDSELAIKIAIKFFIPSQSESKSNEIVGRQQRALVAEARALAKLEHPNIVRVYNVGKLQGRVFVAMEFVAGKTLHDWVLQLKPTWREVIRVYIQLANALNYLHQRGLVHRDFKPDNVLIDETGLARLIDFGLVCGIRDRRDSISSISRLGKGKKASTSAATGDSSHALVGGTPGYMAPEQMQGTAITPAVDQYAFFVSLYESFFKTRPFQGPDYSSLIEVKQQSTVQFYPGCYDYPRWIEDVIRTGLAPAASRRFPNMAVVEQQLRRKASHTLLLTGVGTLCVALLGVWIYPKWASIVEREEMCREQSALIFDVWGNEKAKDLRVQSLALGSSDAASAYSHVSIILDRKSASWSTEAERTCQVRGIERREDSNTKYQLAQQMCLDACFHEYQNFVGAIEEPTISSLKHARQVVDTLCDARECRGRIGDSVETRPAELHRRAQWIRLRSEMNQVLAEQMNGITGDGLEALEALKVRARELSFSGLVAKIDAVVLPEVQYSGTPRTLLERGLMALSASTARGDDNVAMQLIRSLIFVQGLRARNVEAAMELAKRYEALIIRTGSSVTDESSLTDHVVAVLGSHGRLREAEEWSLRSWSRMQATVGSKMGTTEDRRPELHRMYFLLSNLAVTQYYRGHYEDARRTCERYLTWLSRNFGEVHPDYTFLKSNYALILVALGDWDSAVKFANGSIENAKALRRPWDEAQVRARRVLSEAALRARDFPTSRRWAKEAKTGHQAIAGTSAYVDDVLLARIELATEHSDLAQKYAHQAESELLAFIEQGKPNPDAFDSVLHLAQLQMHWKNWHRAKPLIDLAQSWLPLAPEFLEPRVGLIYLAQAQFLFWNDGNREAACTNVIHAKATTGIRSHELELAKQLESDLERTFGVRCTRH